MSSQTTTRKKPSDSLLDKKIKTEDNNTLDIESGGVTFSPVITKYRNNKREYVKTQLSIDGIAKKMSEHSDSIHKTDNIPVDESVQKVNYVELRNKILHLFMSDEYEDIVLSEEDEFTSIEREYIPTLMFLARTQDDTLVHITVSNPFQNKNLRKILSAINFEQSIEIKEYGKEDSIISIDENTEVSVNIHDAKFFPIETETIKESENAFCWEFIKDSQYRNWLEVPIEEINEGTYYEITTEAFTDSPWVLDNPVVWDEEYDIVKLIEEQAYGDPEQLEYVFIRPINRMTDDKIRVAKNEDLGWEIALEKPEPINNESIEKNSIVKYFKDLLSIV